MRTVNIFQAKTDLSKLLAALESRSEREICIARNGKPVAILSPWRDGKRARRLGAAKGKFVVPESIDSANETVLALFTDGKK
jgi:antitoxin (DNA-binding transcriptional repressor) of toxin-antitoxin stability system